MSRNSIRAAILDGPEVTRIIHLRTQYLGPDELLLATKLEFACDDDGRARRARSTP